ncbi:MAG: hypothetical protein ACRC5C_08415 [Bacilli bacterium]
MTLKMHLRWTLFVSFIVVLYPFVRWSIVDLVTLFVEPILALTVFGSFIVLLVYTLWIAFKKRYWQPLVIQVIAIVVLFLTPYTDLILKLDFSMNREARERVVAEITSGERNPNVAYNASLIKLADDDTHLSKGGGEVIVSETDPKGTILFFTFRGVLDNYSGFVYTANGLPPSVAEFGDEIKDIKELNKNWYFVSSY